MKTRSRSRVLGLSLAGAVAAASVAAATVSPAQAAETVTSAEVTYTFVVGNLGDPGGRLVLDVGHTDAVAPVFEDGELVIKTKDDTQLHDPGIVFRDPEDLIFQVKPEAEVSAPGVAPYDFLGPAGSPVWILPMTQNPSLLWPGWSTEHASLAGEFDNIQFQVTDVEGPGEFHLFTNDAFGGIHRHLANNVGTLSNTWTEPRPAHVHANWAFTAPGTYEITFQVSGEWLNAPDPGPGETTTLSITGAEGHFHTGDTVTLTAVQDPPTGEDHYHWFVKPAGASDFTVVNGALEGSYSFTAAAEHEGAQYLVRLYDHDHAVIAESAPVTIEVDDHGGPGEPELSQTIVATLDEADGALVVSVDPDDREVVMSPFELSGDGDRWESTGELRPIRVTDTRSAKPGWTVSGQVGEFSSGGSSFGSEHLGWSPAVVGQDDGQDATAGGSVAPGSAAGDGLSASRPLASAPAGSGLGTADLGGGLDLHVPTSTDPGTYSATLTLTAI